MAKTKSISQTCVTYPLEQRKVVKKSIQSIINWLVFLFIVMIGLKFWAEVEIDGFLPWIMWIAVAIVIIEPIYQYLYFKKYFYDVGADFLIIKKGVVMPRETILNYPKIQDVYVDQDIFDRMFGLFDVHVSTATMMSGMEAHIDGVNKENAAAIRNLILSKMKKGKR